MLSLGSMSCPPLEAHSIRDAFSSKLMTRIQSMVRRGNQGVGLVAPSRDYDTDDDLPDRDLPESLERKYGRQCRRYEVALILINLAKLPSWQPIPRRYD
jgi:hypothetical protein